MEPAMALCSAVAVVTLTLGVLSSAPALSRRLVAIPIPVRPLAVVLTMVSLATVFARPRPAAAAVPPPIVRLADETTHPADESEVSVDGVKSVSPSPSDRSTGRSRVRVEQARRDAAEYVVEPGDSLWRIAAFVLGSDGDGDPSNADIARFWPAIYAANRALIGDNPNQIFPGQRLLIPEG